MSNKLYGFFFALVVSFGSQAQNLMDFRHSMSYTLHLIETKEYQLAYEELQFMRKMDDANQDSVTILLIRVCVFTGRDAELHVMADSLSNNDQLDHNVAMNLMAACLQQDLTEQAKKLMQRVDTAGNAYGREYYLAMLFLEEHYELAEAYYELNKQSLKDTLPYYTILELKRQSKVKSKTLAVLMSVVVPASGKYYVEQPYDASVGLALTTLYGVLSISAFQMAGASSIFGWVNAAAFTAFYVGNIVGTARATDRYNNKVNNRIKSEIKTRLHTLSGF